MNSTSNKLIGKKLKIQMGDRILVAVIKSLSSTYPEYSYNVYWSKEDNPDESYPDDCHIKCTQIHCSQVIELGFMGLMFFGSTRKKLRLELNE